jgi:hypothetical protein
MRLSADNGLLYRPYQGGAMIVAGQSPIGGGGSGIQSWDDPQFEPYRQVARIVEPIRKKDYQAYYKQRDGIDGVLLPEGYKYLNPDHFRAWLARFSPPEENEPLK